MNTLILIPGLICDKIIWQALARSASAHMNIYNADLTKSTSISDMAQMILDDVEGDMIVVGHSLGGRVAMEMARINPARIIGLVLADTGYMPKSEGEEIKRQAMIDLGHESMEKLVAQWLPPMLNPETEPDPQLYADLTDMVLRADADIHERQIRALITRPDASQYLNQINCPTLLLVGRQDGWSPVAQHQEIADEIANSQLVIIEDAGHFAPVEQETKVVKAITNWMNNI
ncbi:MAG: alpha/beta hydrolase [Hyphomicrobiales bacterium]|nr:MAG: alpha/beta hydrolase [Hyphomicrobiales bacterium]